MPPKKSVPHPTAHPQFPHAALDHLVVYSRYSIDLAFNELFITIALIRSEFPEIGATYLAVQQLHNAFYAPSPSSASTVEGLWKWIGEPLDAVLPYAMHNNMHRKHKVSLFLCALEDTPESVYQAYKTYHAEQESLIAYLSTCHRPETPAK